MKITPLLTTEPSRPIRSIDELLAIAHALETEAAARYQDLADQMQHDGNCELAALFGELAEHEREHIEGVDAWAHKATGRSPDRTIVKWEPPQTMDLEGLDATAPGLISGYRALAMAVRNEERAFAFWTYVSAQAVTDAIRTAAEKMAREELEHVSILRRERRKAYHRVRFLDVVPISASDAELRLAELLADRATGSDPVVRDRCMALARESAEAAGDTALQGIRLQIDRRVVDDALTLSEALVEAYLQAADEGYTEAAVAGAQRMAGQAISRLSMLRSVEVQGS